MTPRSKEIAVDLEQDGFSGIALEDVGHRRSPIESPSQAAAIPATSVSPT